MLEETNFQRHCSFKVGIFSKLIHKRNSPRMFVCVPVICVVEKPTKVLTVSTVLFQIKNTFQIKRHFYEIKY
jgi:hypothetical protein